MTCIHGLDETSCPTCRIIASSMPKTGLNLKDLHLNELKPENTYFKQDSDEKKRFIKEAIPESKIKPPISINIVPTPKLLNDKPDFKNRLFNERIKELDITKSDVFKISKKIKLESPEFNPK